MDEIGSFEAKNRFSELIERAEGGEEIVITRRGKPVAKIVPLITPADRERSRLAMERIRARAEKFGGKFDWEEWKAYRDEGRK